MNNPGWKIKVHVNGSLRLYTAPWRLTVPDNTNNLLNLSDKNYHHHHHHHVIKQLPFQRRVRRSLAAGEKGIGTVLSAYL